MSKFLKILLIICIYISIFSSICYANFSDIENHWCESMINNFKEGNFVQGYGDGTFKPDRDITRAELCKIVNSYLGYESSGEWREANMKIAYEKGYLQAGNSDELITREEAFVVLARAMNLNDVDTEITYIDADKISAWAMQAVKTLTSLGYIQGNDDRSLTPKNNITRAEVVSVLYHYTGIGGVDIDIEDKFEVGYMKYSEEGMIFEPIEDTLEMQIGDIITLAVKVKDFEDADIKIISGKNLCNFDKDTFSLEAIKKGNIKLKAIGKDSEETIKFEIKIK